MSLSQAELREPARFVLLTRPNEIGCDDWPGYAPSYAELVAASRPVPEPLRKAAEHLDLCPECAEEFRALLAARKAMAADCCPLRSSTSYNPAPRLARRPVLTAEARAAYQYQRRRGRPGLRLD